MAAKTFSLDFQKVRMAGSSLPAESGIYCVYSCVDKGETVTLKRLIYVGEAKDMKVRHSPHPELDKWEEYLEAGEVLCFTHTIVASADRERCEAALIFEHQPPANTDCKESFKHPDTTIKLTGVTRFLKTEFTVKTTE